MSHRPLSRRAFFKLAATGSAALAVPGVSSAQGKAAGAEKNGDGLLATDWDEVKQILEQEMPNLDFAKYKKLAVNLWNHFRYGAQHADFKAGPKAMLRKALDFNADTNDSKDGSGRLFAKRLGQLKPNSELLFETRYCCYLCGHHALDKVRSENRIEIEAKDYEHGWKMAKAQMVLIVGRASGGQHRLMGGGC